MGLVNGALEGPHSAGRHRQGARKGRLTFCESINSYRTKTRHFWLMSDMLKTLNKFHHKKISLFTNNEINERISIEKSTIFQRGGLHKTDGLLMGDFSKGGVHKIDEFWWVWNVLYRFEKLSARGVSFGKYGNQRVIRWNSTEIHCKLF